MTVSKRKRFAGATSTVCLILLVAGISGCEKPNKQLARFTDIVTDGMHADVSIVLRDDLDEPAYIILVPKDREQDFERVFEVAAGEFCLKSLLSGQGCSYTSKAGHTVFVEKNGPGKYSILTSG